MPAKCKLYVLTAIILLFFQFGSGFLKKLTKLKNDKLYEKLKIWAEVPHCKDIFQFRLGFLKKLKNNQVQEKFNIWAGVCHCKDFFQFGSGC
jgi:hypothetical protein